MDRLFSRRFDDSVKSAKAREFRSAAAYSKTAAAPIRRRRKAHYAAGGKLAD